MNKHLRTFILLSGLLLPLSLLAQGNEVRAGVSISIEQDKEIWAGQQVTLDLDLKTTGFSFSNSHFNLPEVNGAFLMQTDTTTIKLTEKIDGQDWQIVRYPLALYPQKAGQLEIPSINVRFTTSAGFGSEEKAFEFQTEPLELTVKLPPGAKPGDLVVTTTSFELEYDWQPAMAITKTGDAVTLTVSRRAVDISAMLLPPLPVFRAEGLANYPKSPEINDKTDRGDLTGVRTDSITWIVEKPGVYEIPGIRFQWWDPDNRELKQQIVPGLNLDILPSADEEATVGTVKDDGQKSSNSWSTFFLFLTGLAAGVFWLRFGRKTAGPQVNDEKSAFAELQKACKSNKAPHAHSAIHNWIAFYAIASNTNSRPATLAEFGRMLNDDHLAAELRRLQEALVSSKGDWHGDGLFGALKIARQKIKYQNTDQLKNHLAPLNP
ncbi:MAG: BatD family protein [Xanthomonadales bacterium]|nr:BatD family protein [Xanthomonadales bacterium]